MKIEVLAEKCTGCRLCEAVCSAMSIGKFNPSMSAIFIEFLLPEPGIIMPYLCIQCEEQLCLTACPGHALVRDEKLGILVVNRDICNGCGICVTACKYKGIRLDPFKKFAIKCNLCAGEPMCVGICPTGALKLIE